jgi:hypothetical protein
MRFLFGLFSGTVLTLLVATAMDAPTHPVLNGARDLATEAWDQLIARTSDSLFVAPDAPAANPAGRDATTPSAANSEAVAEAAPEQEIADAAASLTEPAPALPPPDPIDELPSSGFWAESALALETAAALETVHANPVWVPFHSQMSAEGFATRLSQSLGREFRVERQGAGAYQVVFDETDPIERDQVLDRVSEVTGQ